MDPFTITAACVSILSGIVTVSAHVLKVANEVRDARKDLDGVRAELASLELCLTALLDEDQRLGLDRTPAVKENLLGILGNCGEIVKGIETVLGNLQKGVLMRVQWATYAKTRVQTLRVNLEAHKSALNIALDLIAISTAADVKRDTTRIRGDAGKIKEDTGEILKEIHNLQETLAGLEIQGNSGFVLQRFLDDSVTYAESRYADSMCDPEEFKKDNPRKDDSTHASARGAYWASRKQPERNELLLEAAKKGNLKRAELLLEVGANIDARDKRGYSPLLLAVKHQHQRCLTLLLNHGADAKDKNAKGVSALDMAGKLSNKKMIALLIKHGADGSLTASNTNLQLRKPAASKSTVSLRSTRGPRAASAPASPERKSSHKKTASMDKSSSHKPKPHSKTSLASIDEVSSTRKNPSREKKTPHQKEVDQFLKFANLSSSEIGRLLSAHGQSTETLKPPRYSSSRTSMHSSKRSVESLSRPKLRRRITT